MKSALPAWKLAESFAHLAKLLDDLRLTASSMSVKMLRAQVGKKQSFSPTAYVVSLQPLK